MSSFLRFKKSDNDGSGKLQLPDFIKAWESFGLVETKVNSRPEFKKGNKLLCD